MDTDIDKARRHQIDCCLCLYHVYIQLWILVLALCKYGLFVVSFTLPGVKIQLYIDIINKGVVKYRHRHLIVSHFVCS